LRPWKPDDIKTRKLQRLVEHRRKIVNDKVRITNRITSLLKEYYPHVLQWFNDPDTIVFCDFLQRWPSLKAVQSARKKTLVTFFRSHNSSRSELIEERVSGIKTAMALTEDEAIVESSALMIQVFVSQLRATLEGIKTLDKAIQTLCKTHPDFSIFKSLPGAGSVYIPRLIVAMGSDRERYHSADDILRYAGVAPVLERSGKKSWVHWRYSAPTFLRQSFVEWVGPRRLLNLESSPFGRAYIIRRNGNKDTAILLLLEP